MLYKFFNCYNVGTVVWYHSWTILNRIVWNFRNSNTMSSLRNLTSIRMVNNKSTQNTHCKYPFVIQNRRSTAMWALQSERNLRTAHITISISLFGSMVSEKQFLPWRESHLCESLYRLQWKAASNLNYQPCWTRIKARAQLLKTQDSFSVEEIG